ncbi:MAG: T9SS type A sorting domain-containing protein [Bacteroidota bacterium]
MRIIATTICCALLAFPLFAQREVPISGNSQVETYYNQQHAQFLPNTTFVKGLEKNDDCTIPEEMGFIPITAGDIFMETVDLDTSGLGENGSYGCLDCDMLSFGNLTLSDNNLTYEALPGISVETETFTIAYCNSAGTECSDQQTFSFLIRRAGLNNFPPAISVEQNEVVQLTAPNNLPGALRCNFFVDCVDNYEGRDQVAYFTDYSGPTDEFIYRASRFAGTDSLCLVLCDEFGICDTTHYAFRLDVSSISPPLYDDFSYAGPVPANEFWLDQEVYVNTELPINPRSIGVATFDGITNRGRPYGGGYGEADRLTSTYLNTSSGDLTLSFWLQRGGLSDRPEIRDSMVLQFRDAGGDWVSVREFTGIPANQPFFEQDTFRFYSENISPPFQHDRFQFRFVNYSDRAGFRDNWHLDYLRLDDNPLASAFFNDIAFTRPPDFILENYSSMPWRHFQPQLNAELSDSIDIGVYNLFSTAQNASPSGVLLQEETTGIIPFGSVPTLFNNLEANIDAGVPINRAYSLMGDPTGFSDVWGPYTASMSSTDFEDEDEFLAFELTYTLENTSQDGLDFVARNDEVSRTTVFSNYFAYDDGTAESAIEASRDQQIAVRFEASVPDTIQGVRFHFPHTIEDFTDQEMMINIWIGELDDTPEYSVEYMPAYASTFFDSLQGFTSYELLDIAGEPAPLEIPAGTFYVGWEQGTTCQFGRCIAVGYDRNRPRGLNNIFVNPGAGWEPISGVTNGSLMLRPVMAGDPPVGTTSTDDILAEERLLIYPNPSRDLVYLQGPEWASKATVEVFANTGQLILQQAYAETLNISTLPAGAYFVRLQDQAGNYTAPQRLIVIK